jgi:hypothetical protein
MERYSSLDTPKWSVLEKISFRFFFLYFSLFIIFQNNGAYPFFGYVTKLWENFLHNYIPWIGKHILGIGYDFSGKPTGSGDTTFDFVILFCVLVLAIFGTIVWSIVHRNATNYRKLYYYLTVAIRFYVGLMLINYGLVKVIQLQFSPPSLYRLTEPYGDSSPMGLAWTFLGFSKGYNLFMGIAEVAAVLLLFRRTLTFGLIITLMTTANVMAVNYFFDIPVKLLSTHLVLMCLFLLAPNFQKLLIFFFQRVPVALRDIYKPKLKKPFRIAFLVIKVFLLVYALGFGTYLTLESKEKYYGATTKSPLEGLYEVKEVTLNSETKTYEEFTPKDWKYIGIEQKERALIQSFDLKRKWMQLEVDEEKKILILIDGSKSEDKVYDFEYEEGDDSDFFLKGTLNQKDTLLISLKRTQDFRTKFLLTNRGFHWVNEYPFNR